MTRDELIRKIQETSKDDDKGFQEIIAAIFDNGFMPEMEMARFFGVSRPTVTRWRTGLNAPMPGMRPLMFKNFIEELQKATS